VSVADGAKAGQHERMSTLRPLLLVLLLAGACCPAGASPLFEDEAVLDVELVGPIHSVTRSKAHPRDFPFVLRVDGRELKVDVRLRGKSRLEQCAFPPLLLDFERGATGQTAFEGQEKLKLVTHCSRGDTGEKNLLEEYTAYRIFNLLSDFSYRVRLLRVSYTDTDDRMSRDARGRYAFVIESTAQLAERLGAVPLELAAVSKRKLDADQAARVYVFQYLVGNTDWSLVHPWDSDECCHNGKLLGRDENIFYVPYDFDQSGIVNASYAKPHRVMHLPNVRARRYRGVCTETDTLVAAMRHVYSQQEAINAAVHRTPGLSEDDADSVVDYLAGYFEKAADEERLLTKFERQCIGR
jgi:hypothetical protein